MLLALRYTAFIISTLYIMEKKKVLVTPQGLKILKEKLKKLEEEYAEVSRGKMEAAELGGNLWHDNPAFEEVEQKQRMLSFNIAELKETLAHAVVAGAEEQNTESAVRIGSAVEVERENGKITTFRIGDSAEADPAKGVISYESPLGGALLGAKEGETREYRAGSKTMKVLVKRITSSA